MRHFMQDNVFQAPGRLLAELYVEPHMSRFAMARSPLCPHSADTPARDLAPDNRFPLSDQRRNLRAELLAVPVLQQLVALLALRSFRDIHEKPGAVEFDVCAARAHHYLCLLYTSDAAD